MSLQEQLLEGLPDAVLVCGDDGRLVFVNRRAEGLFGYGREELLGQRLELLIPARFREHHAAHVKTYLDNPRPRMMAAHLDLFALRKNGTEFPAEIFLAPHGTEGARLVIATVRDITLQKETARALVASQERLRQIIDLVPVNLYAMDGSGRLILANRTFAQSLGRIPQEVEGQPFLTAMEEVSEAFALFTANQQVIRSGKPVELSNQTFTRNGQAALLHKFKVPFREAGTSEPAMLAVSLDVTELRRAQKALADSEARLNLIYETVGDPISLQTVEPDGTYRFQMVNAAWVQTAGMQREQVLGRLLDEIVTGPPLALSLKKRCEAIQTGGPVQYESVFDMPSGRCWVQNTLNPIFDADGHCTHILASTHDLTAQRQADLALLESEARLKLIYDTVGDPISLQSVESDGRYRFQLVNQAWLRSAGLRREEVLGHLLDEVMTGQVLAVSLDRRREAIQAGSPVSFESEVDLPAGRRWVYSTVTPILDGAGRCTHILASTHDLTAQRQAALDLEESEARLKLIYDTVEDPISLQIVRPDGKFVFQAVNRAFLEKSGLRREEVLGRMIEEVFSGETAQAMIQTRNEAIRSGSASTYEGEIEIPAGRRWVRSTVTPILDAEGRCTHILNSTHDLTPQREADEARRESEARLALQYAVAREAATGDPLPEVTRRFLREVCQATGWQVGGLWNVERAGNLLRYVAGWHAPDAPLEPFISSSQTLTFAPGVGLPGRVWVTGQPEWVAEVTGQPGVVRAALASALGLRTALAMPLILDERLLGVLEFFSPDIRRPDAEMSRTLEAVALQIAQVLQGHLKDAQLRQAQKMEAVGQLAGGIAHDFNNLLVVINGHCELMLSKLHRDDPLCQELQLILETGQRAAALTRQMLIFSRREVQDLRVLDLNGVVAELDKMLHRLLPENIGLRTQLAQDLDAVRADPSQVNQVILNLVVNARDAMPQGGKLTIETANVQLDAAYVRAHASAKPGHYVLLAVSDTGNGMTPEVRSHLFEPFFTTKEPGKGTGLGLATVHGIVRQTGGMIEVYSEVGRGTTFKVYLPAVQEARSPAAALPALADQAQRHGVILLVEDSLAVRELVRDVLAAGGHTVLLAHHGGEALTVAASHEGPIDLLVTDVVMPEMGGPELAEHLAAIRPGLKVLFMSGYPDQAMVHAGRLTNGAKYLQKPFTLSALTSKVREVLDG